MIKISKPPKKLVFYDINASTAGDLLANQEYFDNYARGIWKLSNKKEFDERYNIYNVKPPSDTHIKLYKRYKIKEILHNCPVDDFESKCENIVKNIQSGEIGLECDVFKDLSITIRREYMKRIGQWNEKNDLLNYVKMYNVKDIKIVKAIFNKTYEVFTSSNKTVNILNFKGQIDAHTASAVIDSKRTSRPFPSECPLKAKIQLYIYMYLLNFKKGTLILWYKNKHRIYDVHWDETKASVYFQKIFYMRDRITDILNSYHAKKYLLE